MAKKQNIRARDLTAPVTKMVFDGQEYPLRFDLNTFRIAEDIYADEFGKDKNFAEIALELTKGRLGAIMAMYYAALKSAGAEIGWAHFQANFRLTDIPGVKERMTQLVADALPDVDPQDGKADPTKGDEVPEVSSPGTGSGTGL